MEISVIGGGYVGLITAVGLASKGHKVSCIDTDESRVNLINQGTCPFYEDNLEELLRSCVNGRNCLKAYSDYSHISDSEISFICVGTSADSHTRVDCTAVESSAKDIAQILREIDNYSVVVVRSTMTPGATREMIVPALEAYSGKKAGIHFGVAVNPEFLQEGKALSNFLSPSRIVIGEYDQRSGDLLAEIYRDFPGQIIRTDITTAEMIKIASNSFLAAKISFMNEVGNLCKRLGIDAYRVAEGMGSDPRIGRDFLNAGIGFGGSCLPKDIEGLARRAEEVGLEAPIARAVAQVNKTQPSKVLDIARQKLGTLEGKNIALLGLSFKPGVDDIRHSPALEVAHRMLEARANVKAYDPMAMPMAKQSLDGTLQLGASIAETIADADCVVILTEWKEFRDENLYAGKFVIDGRRALDPNKARLVCSSYEGICW